MGAAEGVGVADAEFDGDAEVDAVLAEGEALRFDGDVGASPEAVEPPRVDALAVGSGFDEVEDVDRGLVVLGFGFGAVLDGFDVGFGGTGGFDPGGDPAPKAHPSATPTLGRELV
ncbi:MAG: hypothetical protein ACK5LS_05105 [Propioniciclava sp.]